MFNDPMTDYCNEVGRLCKKYPSVTAAIMSSACMGLLPTDEQAEAWVRKIDKILLEALGVA